MCQTEISIKTELEKDDSINSLEIEKQKDNPTKSSYILKYTRKKNELKELTQETNLPKAKNSLFMLDFIIIKNNEENNESLLQINCHEIAAIHFEDYYERIYSYNDIIKENKYFKAIDNIEEIKDIIDYVLSENFKNSKKIFIKLENNTLYLHIIFTIPKKILKEEEKIYLLPMAMKEIQTKMNYYEKENKKYKKNVFENDNSSIGSNGTSNNNITFYDYYLKIEDKKKKEKIKEKEKEKEKEEEINRSCQQSIINETYDTSYNSIISEEKKIKKKGIIKKKKKKIIKKRIKSKEILKEKESEKDNEIKFENNFF